MAAVFVPDPAGQRAMLATPAMVEAMRHLGELVRIRAEQIAPVVTGAYAFGAEPPTGAHGGGFQLDAGVQRGIAYARIINAVRSAPSKKYPTGFGYGVLLEFGGEHMRAQRILGRALDVLG